MMPAPVRTGSEPSRVVLAYVVGSLNPGGTEKLVIEMSLALADEFEVHVFCLDEPGTWADDLRARGVPVYCLWRQPGLDLALCRKLASALKSIGAGLVHAHQCTPWFYAALARLLYRRPRLLLEEHGRFFPEVDRPLRRLVNGTLIRRLTHRFVAVSGDVRARLERYEGVPAAKIEVIYNGATAAPPLSPGEREARRKALGFDRQTFLVGTVGRFDPIKNLPMLVRSLAAARTIEPRIKGLLIGDGPELHAIRDLIAQLGLEGKLHLTGFREDAPTLVQCLDLFVLPSLSEGISMALLEAMAAGVPAAVTAVGGNPEVVGAGETGWVVPSGAEALLTEVVIQAASAPEFRARLAEAGRRRYHDAFTLEKMMERYRQLYRSMLAAAA